MSPGRGSELQLIKERQLVLVRLVDAGGQERGRTCLDASSRLDHPAPRPPDLASALDTVSLHSDDLNRDQPNHKAFRSQARKDKHGSLNSSSSGPRSRPRRLADMSARWNLETPAPFVVAPGRVDLITPPFRRKAGVEESAEEEDAAERDGGSEGGREEIGRASCRERV